MKKHILSVAILVCSFAAGQTKDTARVNTIDAVTVNGKKALVERKVDRLVYNVRNSMLSQEAPEWKCLQELPY